MISDIKTGNAKSDGAEFSFWFVGSIEEWCRKRGIHFDTEQYGLRQSRDMEVKWGMYTRGDERADWAGCSGRTAMSVLVRGDFTFLFRDPDDHGICREVRLRSQGDYVIWKEDVEHSWHMAEDSEILTIRWTSGDD